MKWLNALNWFNGDGINSARELVVFGFQGNECHREINTMREPLRVWWKKCGTRNDSSAGSRPGRQARGGIQLIALSCAFLIVVVNHN